MKILPHHLQGRECWLGTRRFFRRHGLDFARFVREGIEIETIEAIDDAMGRAVAARVRAEVTNGE